MKIKIEIIDTIEDEEIIIKCAHLDEKIKRIQNTIASLSKSENELCFLKDSSEYFFPLSTILFFETDSNLVYAHTVNDIYQVKYRLYELENILPNNFIRISKSGILNINKVFSITNNFSSSNLINFFGTHKQIYASRMYYRHLKEKMKTRRIYEK